MSALLELSGVARRWPAGRSGLLGAKAWVDALLPMDLSVAEGEALGVVGESGSGKTTLARIAAGLLGASSGCVRWRGAPIEALSGAKRRAWRREVQYVFQHPTAALNPRWRIGRILDDTLVGLTDLGRRERRARIAEIGERVGLRDVLLERFAHQLSGGQAQRVALARALLGRPRLLILDEPVSALDVSLQAQVLNLLVELRSQSAASERPLAYMFISHDLAVVERLCERVLVMQQGSVVEQGSREQILKAPTADYTCKLLEAVPRLTTPAVALTGAGA